MQLLLQIKTDYYTQSAFICKGFIWLFKKVCYFGGGKRDRTDDPLLAKQVLYQLSYAPVLGGSGRT